MMCEWYDNNFLVIEFYLSVIIWIIVIVFLIFISPLNWDENFINFLINPVFPIIATISVTLLGFIITGVSILITFPNSDNIQLLKKSKSYGTLFDIFISTMKVLALTAILALIGIFSRNIILQIIFFRIWDIFTDVHGVFGVLKIKKIFNFQFTVEPVYL